MENNSRLQERSCKTWNNLFFWKKFCNVFKIMAELFLFTWLVQCVKTFNAFCSFSIPNCDRNGISNIPGLLSLLLPFGHLMSKWYACTYILTSLWVGSQGDFFAYHSLNHEKDLHFFVWQLDVSIVIPMKIILPCVAQIIQQDSQTLSKTWQICKATISKDLYGIQNFIKTDLWGRRELKMFEWQMKVKDIIFFLRKCWL